MTISLCMHFRSKMPNSQPGARIGLSDSKLDADLDSSEIDHDFFDNGFFDNPCDNLENGVENAQEAKEGGISTSTRRGSDFRLNLDLTAPRRGSEGNLVTPNGYIASPKFLPTSRNIFTSALVS